MNEQELIQIIKNGETSKVQFKQDFDNQDKIASEIIAMSNAYGGIIIFGVEDKSGKIVGLDYERLQFIGNKLATIANDLVKPQVFIMVEVITIEDDAINDINNKKILVAYIDEGTAKPYKDNNGTIWMKQSADKRKVTDNNELLRLFQQSGTVFVDEMTVPDTSIEDIDSEKVKEYIQKTIKNPDEYKNIEKKILYQNLNILKKENLTLGGVLFFSKEPQLHCPLFCVKAIAFYGNDLGGLHYRDSRNLTGSIPELFYESMQFFKANLRHEQKGQNFNSTGILEISEIALEELIQNALIHRDYTQNSPIRLMIFDNRIEISSPGRLPNNLTVENIKLGTAVVRNNLIASYASKILKYRGFGTGIIRALNEQPNIEFSNNVECNHFITKIPRMTLDE